MFTERLGTINKLTLSIMGKHYSRHFGIFLLFFPENRLCHFMQIVSLGDNLYEMPKPSFLGKKKSVSLSSAEFARRLVKVELMI